MAQPLSVPRGAGIVVASCGDDDRGALAWARREAGPGEELSIVPLSDPGQARARLLVIGRVHGALPPGGWQAIVRATTSTAVIPADWDEADLGPVVVGVDGSALSRQALAYGFGYASLRGLPVLAVHATGLADGVDFDWRPSYGWPQTLLHRELAPWRARYPGVRVRELFSHRSPVVALVETARRASLLALGTRGNGPEVGAIGSLARAVVTHAGCPIVLTRS